jgi:hypothetical protein
MTAVELFYKSLHHALLPVAVPISGEGQVLGLASQGVVWLGNEDAEEMILSPDPQMRAAAAIFAAHEAHLSVERQTERV